MRTPITEMFGIEFPILAFSHCRDVVVAVSQAGGMGVLGAVALSDDQLEVDLAWIEEEIGNRPYGVDLVVPSQDPQAPLVIELNPRLTTSYLGYRRLSRVNLARGVVWPEQRPVPFDWLDGRVIFSAEGDWQRE